MNEVQRQQKCNTKWEIDNTKRRLLFFCGA